MIVLSHRAKVNNLHAMKICPEEHMDNILQAVQYTYYNNTMSP